MVPTASPPSWTCPLCAAAPQRDGADDSDVGAMPAEVDDAAIDVSTEEFMAWVLRFLGEEGTVGGEHTDGAPALAAGVAGAPDGAAVAGGAAPGRAVNDGRALPSSYMTETFGLPPRLSPFTRILTNPRAQVFEGVHG